MYLGFNELSLHGQFAEHEGSGVVQRLLEFRKAATDHNTVLHCRSEVLHRLVCDTSTLESLLYKLPPQDNRRRLMLRWLTTEGPFLEDDRQHLPDTWFECVDEIVTDWTLGELAHRSADSPVAAASMVPSKMASDPLTVTRVEDVGRVEIALSNHATASAVRAWLGAQEPEISSWEALSERARTTCTALVFADNAFAPLRGLPFHPGVAGRLLDRLRVLHTLKQSFGADGALTTDGQVLRQKHFVGEKAWFSDSSEGEKSEFARELTFPHPTQPGETLFCPWHGKVKTPQMRVHYSEPITASLPVFVVYVGPKITKR